MCPTDSPTKTQPIPHRKPDQTSQCLAVKKQQVQQGPNDAADRLQEAIRHRGWLSANRHLASRSTWRDTRSFRRKETSEYATYDAYPSGKKEPGKKRCRHVRNISYGPCPFSRVILQWGNSNTCQNVVLVKCCQNERNVVNCLPMFPKSWPMLAKF